MAEPGDEPAPARGRHGVFLGPMSHRETDETGSAQDILKHLADKWAVPVLSALAERPRRFNELRRRIGITANMLTRCLSALDGSGLITRVTWPSGPLYVEYEITRPGREYLRRIKALERWASKRIPPRAVGSSPVSTAPRHQCGPEKHQAVWTSLGPAPLMHVCLAVTNIAESSRAFAKVVGIPAPQVRSGTITHESNVGQVLTCGFRFPNFLVEFVQHFDGASPFRDAARRRGNALHHVAFHVARQHLDERIAWLEQKGGVCVAGGTQTHYADMDFQSELGTTLELLSPLQDGEWGTFPWTSAIDTANPDRLGSCRVAHIGVVVRNVERAATGHPAHRTCRLQSVTGLPR